MKEEKLLELIGQIDPKHVAAAQRHRNSPASRGKREYTATAEREGSMLRWFVPSVCGLATIALALLIPGLYRGGQAANEPSVGVTDRISLNITAAASSQEAEPTTAAQIPPIIGQTPYCLVFDTVEDYWALQDAVELSDEALQKFLQDKQYNHEDCGIDTRARLMEFVEDTQYLPIPSLPGDTLKEICIREHETTASFVFTGFTMEVAKIADKKAVENRTRSLSLIWDYKKYPLYMGSESISGGVAYVTLWMNAENYLVRISTETDDKNRFVDSLEELTFQFPEIAPDALPEGVYGGELEGFKWTFVEQTGVLNFSPLQKNAGVYGYIILGEAPWQGYAAEITSIVVEEGIVRLDSRSIAQLPNLQSVSLPESLVKIGDEVFAGCGIQDLRIPVAVTEIGTGVAKDCPRLQKVEINAWQPYIGQSFLQNCSALQHITTKNSTGYWNQIVLPTNPHLVGIAVDCALDEGFDYTALYDENGVLWSYQENNGALSISGTGTAGMAPAGILSVWDQVQTIVISEGITALEGSFAEMTALRSVSLPSTMKKMVSFFGCKNLEMITIPNGIKELPSNVFKDCEKLKYITLPESLEKIYSAAFARCIALEYISIPDSVTWIDDLAFLACTSLKEVRLSKELRRMGGGIFRDCVQLETVTVQEGLLDMGAYCFYGCSSLRSLVFLGTQEQWDTLYGRCADVIPEGVAVKVAAQTPAPEQTVQTPAPEGTLQLWWLIPVAVVAAGVVLFAVIKRKNKA